MEAGIWTIWDRNPTSNKLKQTNMYKVGDKVRVRGDLKTGELYGGIPFPSYMNRLSGKQGTIRLIDSRDDTCKIKEDSDDYWWTKEMFESNPSNKLFKLM